MYTFIFEPVLLWKWIDRCLNLTVFQYTYCSEAFTAAMIFADNGFVVEPHVAARLPLESISTLLKFQDGTNPVLFFKAL